jgi:HrpA-like RNA helicase
MALDTVVLRLKSLSIKDVVKFPYLSKPSEEGLLNSLETMKMLGCLNTQTSTITAIGELLVRIPI